MIIGCALFSPEDLLCQFVLISHNQILLRAYCIAQKPHEPGLLVPVSFFRFFKERFLRIQGNTFAEREAVSSCCGLVYLKKGLCRNTYFFEIIILVIKLTQA